MYKLISNSVTHELLERGDLGHIKLISYLTPYNLNSAGTPTDNNFLGFGTLSELTQYDLLLLEFYFTDAGYGPNKIIASGLYPVELFKDAPIETNYKAQGFISAEYISADSVTRGNCLRHGLYLLKTGTSKVLAQSTADDIKGILYGIKL